MRLLDKVCLVTGAGQGIGEAIARAFVEERASVIVADLDIARAKNVASRLNSIGKAMAIQVDVTRESDIKRMVDSSVEMFGGIDILVNNAGIAIPSPAEEVTEYQWRAVLDTNLTSALLCSKAVMKVMLKRGHGKIINIASAAGHVPAPNMVAYSVSKAGIIQLTKALAIEWGKHNINVNSVSPGVTSGAMLNKLIEENPEAFSARQRRIPLKRVNDPKDVARVVVFLGSTDGDNITGEDILIDGGMLAVHPGLV